MTSAEASGFVREDETPPGEAFHVEKIMDPFSPDKVVVGMVRHAGRPWVAELRKPLRKMLHADWHALGRAYLDALDQVRTWPDPEWIHPDIRKALGKMRAREQRSFGWLPVTWEEAPADRARPGSRKPLGSFWVDREDSAKKKQTPRLLVLLAGSVVTEHQLQTGGDMGLRIVLHVHAGHVRVHGITLSGLSTNRVLEGVPDPWPDKGKIFGLVEKVRKEVGDALDCGTSVWVGNLEKVIPAREGKTKATDERLIATGFALRWRRPWSDAEDETASRWGAPTRARCFDFRVELSLDRSNGKVGVVQVQRDFFVNSGAADGAWSSSETGPSQRRRAFVQDAASKGSPCTLSQRRSTRSDEALDAFRDDIEDMLPPPDQALRFGAAGSGTLFEIRGATREGNLLGGSTVARNTAGVVQAGRSQPSSPPQRQAGANSQHDVADAAEAQADPVLRSDAQGSIDAHLRGAELFTRMLAYGMKPRDYFRFAKLPLVQRVRPAMRWAPDGELPNAEVRPFMGDAEADESSNLPWPNPRDPLQLLVKYGSADPVHRRKVPFVASAHGDGRADGRVKAQYLSTACDPRWAWHEFGHVLAFAATGELELPFAHSPGDALAAIAADPISGLATARDPESEIRHTTFPWIEVPGRSHGRSATRGYGWCGCRNLARLEFSASLERYHHNYFGEQILSSSLFRLYRSLGGDTRDVKDDVEPTDRLPDVRQPVTDDEAMRLSASDYCIYLIMRGLSLLGPDSLAPARTPDQFVSALIEADLGTGDWIVEATWPFNRPGRRVARHGGRVHKVIRWAFEQQGLYATDDPTATSEELGKPPAVDVFMDDLAGRNGGYAPIPLRYGMVDSQPWHAHLDWIRRMGCQFTVKVQNGGRETAKRTGLRVWWASTTDAVDAQLDWKPVTGVASRDIAAGASQTYMLELPSLQADESVWLLVSADAPADPSNLTVKTPPGTWPELLELVAHDNNLALARR